MKYIICDLDNTLIQGDSTKKAFKKLLKEPSKAIKSIFILMLFGKAKFKEYVFKIIDIDYEINKDVLNYLKKQKEIGKIIVLATGTHFKFAQKFAYDVCIFDYVIATTDVNCVGYEKLKKIKQLTKDDKFIYIGDSWQDLPIWKVADEIGAMNLTFKLKTAVEKLKKPLIYFYV